MLIFESMVTEKQRYGANKTRNFRWRFVKSTLLKICYVELKLPVEICLLFWIALPLYKYVQVRIQLRNTADDASIQLYPEINVRSWVNLLPTFKFILLGSSGASWSKSLKNSHCVRNHSIYRQTWTIFLLQLLDKIIIGPAWASN